jgi:serine/threonine protein kinase
MALRAWTPAAHRGSPSAFGPPARAGSVVVSGPGGGDALASDVGMQEAGGHDDDGLFEMDGDPSVAGGVLPRPPPLKMLNRCTVGIVDLYSACSADFRFESSLQPRRCLTKNNTAISNEGRDNSEGDFILHARDVLGAVKGRRYQVLDMLGKGTFGQVVKCVNMETREIAAVKVVKNKAAYFNQGLVEIQILEILNHQFDAEDKAHIVRLLDYFVYRNHLCLVFELLSVNLFELLKQNQYKGLPMTLIRCFTMLILESLCTLMEAGVIHCDLKPENVLLQNLGTPAVKTIDFGSACFRDRTVYSYIQSRFYRCPEVMLGCRYGMPIDMWSLGCITAELFIGLPLFPGTSEHNQLRCIIDMLGPPPELMLRSGTKTSRHFDVHEAGMQPQLIPGMLQFASADGQTYWTMKSEDQYCRETNTVLKPPKRYFKYPTLPEIIEHYQMRPGLSPAETAAELELRRALTHFLLGVLNFDGDARWTPHQALRHPFLTGEPFLGDWEPPTQDSLIPPERQRVPRVIPWGIHPSDATHEVADTAQPVDAASGTVMQDPLRVSGSLPNGYGFGVPSSQFSPQHSSPGTFGAAGDPGQPGQQHAQSFQSSYEMYGGTMPSAAAHSSSFGGAGRGVWASGDVPGALPVPQQQIGFATAPTIYSSPDSQGSAGMMTPQSSSSRRARGHTYTSGVPSAGLSPQQVQWLQDAQQVQQQQQQFAQQQQQFLQQQQFAQQQQQLQQPPLQQPPQQSFDHGSPTRRRSHSETPRRRRAKSAARRSLYGTEASPGEPR